MIYYNYSPYTVLPVISLGQDRIVGQYIAQSEDWPAPLSPAGGRGDAGPPDEGPQPARSR